jgi:hypothetical protein
VWRRLERYGCCAALALLAGCGYGFAGRPAHLPPDARTIGVERFRNDSRQIGVELILQAALEDVISERGVLRVVPDESGALVLSGEVRAFTSISRPVAFSTNDRAVIYASSMVLDVRLKARDGNVLWHRKGLVEASDAAVSSTTVVPSSPGFQQGNLSARDVTGLTNIQLAEDRLTEDVVRELVNEMARSIYSQMLEGF